MGCRNYNHCNEYGGEIIISHYSVSGYLILICKFYAQNWNDDSTFNSTDALERTRVQCLLPVSDLSHLSLAPNLGSLALLFLQSLSYMHTVEPSAIK